MKRVAAALVLAAMMAGGASAQTIPVPPYGSVKPVCRADDGLTPQKRAIMALNLRWGSHPTNVEDAAICAVSAALDGDTEAQSVLGLIYANWGSVAVGIRSGPLQPDDVEAAVYWLNKAGSAGNAQAAYPLGLLYAYGVGAPQDDAKAERWFKQAKSGYFGNDATAALAGLAERPQREKNYLHARLGKAAGGDVNAMLELANGYFEGFPLRRDVPTAVAWLQKAADAGDAEAQFRLGALYYHGVAVPRDLNMAADWLLKSPKGRNPASDALLNDIYHSDELDAGRKAAVLQWAHQSVNTSVKEATPVSTRGAPVAEPASKPDLTALQAQATKGDLDAEYTLGLAYLGEYGGQVDMDKAIASLSHVADQGVYDAYVPIADAYYSGKVVAKDYAKALSWYEKAADKADEVGLYNAAVMYRDGLGAPVDLQKAYVLAIRLSLLDGGLTNIRAEMDESRTDKLLASIRPKLSVEDRAKALKAACEMYLAWHPLM